MKLKNLDVPEKIKLERKALQKLPKIIEKLVSEECLNSLADNVVNKHLHGRRSKTYETIQGLMYPIEFSKGGVELYDEEKNYIGEQHDIRKCLVQYSESDERSTLEHIPDRYTYEFSNIVIRNCLSKKIEYLLDEDWDIRNDACLREII